MADTFEQVLDVLKAKGEALGDALVHEQELEDDRAAIKADAVVRIMARDGIAATPAEKIVETDLQYLRHRAEQRASIVARFRADAEYEAAKAAATQASLITPSMIELQTKIKKLELDVKIQKQERENAEGIARRANSKLSERIRDVDALTQRNRRFFEALDEMTPRPVAVFEAWEESAARRATALPGLTTPAGPHEQPGDVMAGRE